MKFLIVDTYYPTFLRTFYARHLELARRPYAEQWHALMDQCFGTADFYSANLQKLGHEAAEVVANCEPLQRQWAREHGTRTDGSRWTIRMRKGFIPWPQRIQSIEWFYPILTAQVKHYRPDVLHIQNMNGTGSAFLREIRPYVRLITGQIACPMTPGANFSEYGLVLSSLPHYVQRFRGQGLNSQLFRLGFEPTVLIRLVTFADPYLVVHVGGYSPVHRERNELLEVLVTHGIPLSCWGFGIDYLPTTSAIRNCYQGEAWGLEMYNIRRNSKIVVSRHVSSVADVYANIMTLYEATGVGTLLVIDERKDLQELFEPGKEVVTYACAEDCIEKVRYLLEHEDERAAIAKAGQERTLREHTYYHRMQELVDIVRKYL